MGNTVEWSDFVSFRNIFLTHNFCIIIIIIGQLQNFALLILVAILPAASFQVAKLLRTVDPLLHIGSISVPLPSSSSSFQDVRRLKANFHSWPTVGPHLTGLTYFPWLAARINAIVIINLRQKKEISIPLQHRASPHRVYLLSLMTPPSKFFLPKKNLANIELRPHLTSQGWPTSRYWLHQPSLHLLPLDFLSHRPNWL